MDEALERLQEQVHLTEQQPETQVLHRVLSAEVIHLVDHLVLTVQIQEVGVAVTADLALLQEAAVAIQAQAEVPVVVAILEEVVEVKAPEVVVEALQVQEDQDN